MVLGWGLSFSFSLSLKGCTVSPPLLGSAQPADSLPRRQAGQQALARRKGDGSSRNRWHARRWVCSFVYRSHSPELFQRVGGIHRKGGGGGESLRQGRDSRMEAGEGEREDEVTRRTRRSRGWRGRKKTRADADWICPRARAVELRSPIPVLWTRAVELVLGTEGGASED